MVGRGNMQKRRFHGCRSGAGRGGREVGKVRVWEWVRWRGGVLEILEQEWEDRA
jgi:hypothetical protein